VVYNMWEKIFVTAGKLRCEKFVLFFPRTSELCVSVCEKLVFIYWSPIVFCVSLENGCHCDVLVVCYIPFWHVRFALWVSADFSRLL
jgi:hypothetical protein